MTPASRPLLPLTVLGLVVVLTAAGALVIARLTNWHVPLLSPTCRVFGAGQAMRWEPEQLAHAATVATTAVQRTLPARAVTVALATALQESKLRNLAGGDRDSVGLFQQRPSQGWGTVEQLRDPRYATQAFYTGLTRIPDWERMSVTEAAQAVQRSGFPTAYERWEDEARVLTAAFLGQEAGAVTCRTRTTVGVDRPRPVGDLLNELRLDLRPPPVTSRERGDRVVLTVPVGSPRSPSALGWRTAHWFVARSATYGVTSVAYGRSTWTARGGRWAAATAAPGPEKVVITIGPARSR